MTELVESIAFDTGKPWECPFSHHPVKHNKVNIIPAPKTKNNSTTLSSNLDADSKHLTPIKIQVNGNDHTAQFSAHHLIPGNEAWPNSNLYKWVDKRPGHIIGDIGYDVNCAENGVDLPSHSSVSGWRAKEATPAGMVFQKDFAFACMEADSEKRQFHDRHAAYSNFVIKVLNKVAKKLEPIENEITPPGCTDENCSAGEKKPFAPPYALNARLDAIAQRLEGYLTGDEVKWKKPLLTSRFALMYHKRSANMTQNQARAELSVDNFK